MINSCLSHLALVQFIKSLSDDIKSSADRITGTSVFNVGDSFRCVVNPQGGDDDDELAATMPVDSPHEMPSICKSL